MEVTTFSSPLVSYLTKVFGTGQDAERNLREHFWEQFKVFVRQENDLFIFKYDQTLCELWDMPAVHECRGTIVRKGTNRKRKED